MYTYIRMENKKNIACLYVSVHIKQNETHKNIYKKVLTETITEHCTQLPFRAINTMKFFF